MRIPPEMEERYRRFLNGRGDAISSLVSFMGEESGARTGSRAWAALVLSRIYLVKGELERSKKYLRKSVRYFETAGMRYPAGILVNWSLINKYKGNILRAERLLRRAFQISLGENQIYCAAKASSNLATLLARKGELREAGSFIVFSKKIYRTLKEPDSENLLRMTEALIGIEGGDLARAIDQLAVFLNRSDDKKYDLGFMTASLLLAETLVRMGEYKAASRKLADIEAGCPLARLLLPRRMGLLYLNSVAASGMGDKESELRYREDAEKIRRNLGFAPFERFGNLEEAAPLRRLYFNLKTNGERNEAGKSDGKPGGGKTHRANLFAGMSDDGVEFITGDPFLKSLLKEIEAVSKNGFPVLVRGETGTGKDLIARKIHFWSERRCGRFVPVNMAGMPAQLFESVMFGHTRGAFTGAVSNRKGLIESARDGTVFLDEIGDMGKLIQLKLLRYLEAGEYYRLGESTPRKAAARLVAATNRNLEEAVEKGEFRADLYHRLRVLEFKIPSLSKRTGDIELLARYFLEILMKDHKLEIIRFGEATMEVLKSYSWPGNVRELKNETTRASLRASPPEIKVSDLSPSVISGGTMLRKNREGGLRDYLAEVERKEIARAMGAARGNRALAARILGIERTTLIYRLKKLGLERLK